jgi:ATP-dependent Clp protease adaptor protein ClpS
MSQVESMRGAKILTPRRRGIESCGGARFDSPPLWVTRTTCCPGYPTFVAELPDETHYDGPSWIHADAKPGTQTSPDIDVEEKLKEAFSRGWSVIVWNDPVNLMDYVVYVFKTVLKMNEKDASKHMWEVHQTGKSLVARETREKSELIVHRLRGFGLNATLEQES